MNIILIIIFWIFVDLNAGKQVALLYRGNINNFLIEYLSSTKIYYTQTGMSDIVIIFNQRTLQLRLAFSRKIRI